MGNLRLLSYFIPHKFEFDKLQNIRLTDVSGAFVEFLKRDIHTYDMNVSNNVVTLELYNDEPVDKISNKNLQAFDIEEIDIDYNEQQYLSFLTTDNIEYSQCTLTNMRFDEILHGMSCALYNNSYILCDVINFKGCILPTQKMCDALLDRY